MDRVLQQTRELPHSYLTGQILKCSFEVMSELGSGFLESVYKAALVIALKDCGHDVTVEKAFEIYFRKQRIGLYLADLVVNETVIVELKCCHSLLLEHQAQVINYLAAADLPVGLLINFGHRNLQYKRLCHPFFYPAANEVSDLAAEGDLISF